MADNNSKRVFEVGSSSKSVRNNGRQEMEIDIVYDFQDGGNGSGSSPLTGQDNLNNRFVLVPPFNYVQNAEAEAEAESEAVNSSLTGQDNLNNRFVLVPPFNYVQNAEAEAGAAAGDVNSSLFPAIGDDNSRHCIARCSRSDYSAIAQLNSSFRSLLKERELYKLRRELGVVEHWIYFACSLRHWEVFDPIRLRWRSLPPVPSGDCFSNSDKESLAVGTDLFIFGRDITTHLTYKYSIFTEEWTIAGQMHTPRCLFASAAFGGKAIVAGGVDIWGRMYTTAELYDSDTETWEVLPSMNFARKKSSGVFMDGKFYAIGGQAPKNVPLTSGEVYDLESRTWTVIPDMLPPREMVLEEGQMDRSASASPPLLTVVNNELYAADHEVQVLKKYIKGSNSWVSLGSMPERAHSMNGWGLAFRGCGDKLVVIGGPSGSYLGHLEVNAWVPCDGPPQWTVLGHRHSNGFIYNCAIMEC